MHSPITRRSFTGFASAIICAALCSYTAIGLQQQPPFHDQDNLVPIRFEERQGEYEFSGEMLVRPFTIDDLRSEGLTVEAAQRRYDEARAILNTQFDVLRTIPQIDAWVIELPAGTTENEVAAQLLATDRFKHAGPNWIVYPVECPDDPDLELQWHHADDLLNSCAGWDYETGDPTHSVGICDAGVRTTHQDLRLHRYEGYNAIDRLWESEGGSIDAVRPHGTWTTGCAAANGDNGVGVTGVGWNLGHRMIRVSNDGSSLMDYLYHGALVSAEAGDRAVSLSWGFPPFEHPNANDVAKYVRSQGGLLFWAGGNTYLRYDFVERDDDDIIFVGGTNVDDEKPDFASWGPFLDIAGPAMDVYMPSSESDDAYAVASGTSFATPMAAGLALMMWSVDASLTPDEVEFLLKETSDDIGASGIDEEFGYGRINIERAMRGALGDLNIRLIVDELTAGESASLSALHATRGRRVYFGYSVIGTEETYVQPLDVTINLSQPVLIGSSRADANGRAHIEVTVPNQATGLTVWLQAVQYQRTSQVWKSEVQ